MKQYHIDIEAELQAQFGKAEWERVDLAAVAAGTLARAGADTEDGRRDGMAIPGAIGSYQLHCINEQLPPQWMAERDELGTVRLRAKAA